MKSFILLSLLALSTLSLTSCLKSYECDCPSGTKLKVSTTDEMQARNMCEEKSGGRCSL